MEWETDKGWPSIDASMVGPFGRVWFESSIVSLQPNFIFQIVCEIKNLKELL